MRGLSFVPSTISLSKLRWHFFFHCRLIFALKSLRCHGVSQCFVSFITTHITLYFITVFSYHLCLPLHLTSDLLLLQRCSPFLHSLQSENKKNSRLGPEWGAEKTRPQWPRLRASSTMGGTKRKRRWV